MTNYRTYNRRGVTLLFVVSMIVLFLLMGTAFVVVANNFMQASKTRGSITAFDIESLGEHAGQKFLNQSLYELLRGPSLNNVNSPLRGHSILGDMYGYGLTSYVKSVEDDLIQTPGTNPTNSTAPQFVRLQLIAPDINLFGNTPALADFATNVVAHSVLNGKAVYSSVPMGTIDTTSPNLPDFDILPSAPGRFNGQVLTFVSGTAKGISSRIIDHQVFPFADTTFDGGIRYEHRFVVMLLNPTSEITPANLATNVYSYDDLVAAGETNISRITKVVINGRPFAGTGAGTYDTRNVAFDAPALNGADMPNQTGMTLAQMISGTLGVTPANYLARTAKAQDGTTDVLRDNSYATNESHDAADLQNMFLGGNFVMSTGTSIVPNTDPIASFDTRNGVMNPFKPQMILDGTLPDAEESTASMNYPYLGADEDFDNDGDGENDSIFIDANLPIYTTPEGKRIKPMVAYQVVDLDSKININLHGNRSQIADYGRFSNSTFAVLPQADGLVAPGQGYGPSEVLLNTVFDNMEDFALAGDDVARLEADRLMIGLVDSDRMVLLNGRYGESLNTNRLNAGGGPVPGNGVDGSFLGQEAFSAYKLFGYPFTGNNGADPGGVLGGLFQSNPMDLYGRFYTGFPTVATGFTTSMPVIDIEASSLVDSEIINNPYEVNHSLTASGRNDDLYSLQELELIYRQGDSDLAGFPIGRLPLLAPSLDRNQAASDGNTLNDLNYLAFTTDSWEVPALPQEFVNGELETLTGKLHAVLSMTAPLYGVPAAASPVDRESLIMANISGYRFGADYNFTLNDADNAAMLSTDVRMGRPFNINRPFGNGVDDDGDGIVDELFDGDLLSHPDGTTNIDFDYDSDSIVASGDGDLNSPLLSRQQFARQLYVLALLATELVDRDGDGSFIDTADFPDFNNDGTTNNDDRLAYREAIAQWAVNVVDFRDPDSIMTPFEFDLNPWNGWDVDGDIGTINPPQEPASERKVVWG